MEFRARARVCVCEKTSIKIETLDTISQPGVILQYASVRCNSVHHATLYGTRHDNNTRAINKFAHEFCYIILSGSLDLSYAVILLSLLQPQQQQRQQQQQQLLLLTRNAQTVATSAWETVYVIARVLPSHR